MAEMTKLNESGSNSEKDPCADQKIDQHRSPQYVVDKAN